MNKILLAEDDQPLRMILTNFLKSEQYEVHSASTGSEALEKVTADDFDLIILDWDLPEVSGLKVLETVRSLNKSIPVLMMTGKNRSSEKVAALDAGADDYLTKPIAVPELAARLRSLLRRPHTLIANTLKAGDLQLDTKNLSVHKAGVNLQLSTKEFALLEFFLRHPNQVFTVEDILVQVWESEAQIGYQAVRMCIMRLRDKICDNNGFSPLQTLQGQGYRFNILPPE